MAQVQPLNQNMETAAAPLTMMRATASANAKAVRAATAAQNVEAAQIGDGPLSKLSGEQLGPLSKESLSKMSFYRPQSGGNFAPAGSIAYSANRTIFRDEGGAPTSNNVMGTQKQGATEAYSGCKTCHERQYQDGSDDAGVSFQTPKHIPASTAGIAVASHEGEHVSRESDKAAREGRVVTQKTVTMQMSCCPECNRVYVAGGTTKIATMADKSATADNQNGLSLAGGAGENLDMDV